MTRLARVVAVGVPHHVTQSGNARQSILNTDADRKVYLEDRFSTIATLRHVVRETGYHHADQTRHKCKLNANQTEGYAYRVDALRLAGISIVRI
jgi:hypothetical protein